MAGQNCFIIAQLDRKKGSSGQPPAGQFRSRQIEIDRVGTGGLLILEKTAGDAVRTGFEVEPAVARFQPQSGTDPRDPDF
jgi:hypothetical protein